MRRRLLVLVTALLCTAPAVAQTVPGAGTPPPPPQARPPILNPSRPMFDEPRWRSVEDQRLAEQRLHDRIAERQRAVVERERDQDLQRVWGDANRQRAEDWRAHEDIARLRDMRQLLRDLDPPPPGAGPGR